MGRLAMYKSDAEVLIKQISELPFVQSTALIEPESVKGDGQPVEEVGGLLEGGAVVEAQPGYAVQLNTSTLNDEERAQLESCGPPSTSPEIGQGVVTFS